QAEDHGVWIARLAMAAIFSLPLFAAWSLLESGAPPLVRGFRLVLTLGSMMVMGAMVFVKQHMLDGELMELLRASGHSYENLTRLQEQLVKSEKLASLGQLVGGAAHEINNPLTAMLGYSDLLAETSLSGEQRDLAERIGYEVRHTMFLVSSLLSFAKQVPGEKTLLDVNALAEMAIKLSQAHLHGRSIQLTSHLQPDLPQVRGDSNQLLQVWLHIINNAVHAMENTAGALTIETRQQHGMVVLLKTPVQDVNNSSAFGHDARKGCALWRKANSEAVVTAYPSMPAVQILHKKIDTRSISSDPVSPYQKIMNLIGEN